MTESTKPDHLTQAAEQERDKLKDVIVRCHCCQGTQIWKRNEAGEVEVFHDCASGLHAMRLRAEAAEHERDREHARAERGNGMILKLEARLRKLREKVASLKSYPNRVLYPLDQTEWEFIDEILRAKPSAEPRLPDGFAYRYPDDTLRFNHGETVNGSDPIAQIPFYFNSPHVSASPSADGWVNGPKQQSSDSDKETRELHERGAEFYRNYDFREKGAFDFAVDFALSELKRERGSALAEMRCCDDVRLDIPLAESISELQSHRARLERELHRAHVEIGTLNGGIEVAEQRLGGVGERLESSRNALKKIVRACASSVVDASWVKTVAEAALKEESNG